MSRSVKSAVNTPPFKSVWRSVVGSFVVPEVVYTVKSFYFNNFTDLPNSTLLRSLPGWAAYSSSGATSGEKDSWIVQSGAITRYAYQEDYSPSPGRFSISRDSGSQNHVFRAKIVSIPSNGGKFVITVGGSANGDCIVFSSVNSNGVMQHLNIEKSVGGVITQLSGGASAADGLGRSLQAGDELEVRVFDRQVHLYVNGYQSTSDAGASVDAGGAFNIGGLVGFGTTQGVGVVFDDIYIAQLSAQLSINNLPVFTPGSLVLGGSLVSITGTYAGQVSELDYRVVDSSTGTTIKDWARTPSVISAGVWSANVFAPMSTTLTNPKCRIQVRAANDVDTTCTSNTTAVGLCVANYGQSNSAYMGQGVETEYAVANAYTWSSDAGSAWAGWATTTPTRAGKWASELASASGIPCGVFVTGVGSAPISALISTLWPDALTKMDSAKVRGYIAAWLWTQGESESDAYTPFNTSQYRDNFSTLLGLLRGVSSSQTAPVGVCVIGSFEGTHVLGQAFGDANWSAARATLSGLNNFPGVSVYCNLFDLPHYDAFHYISSSYVENGRRAGLSMAKVLGYGGSDGRGPLITGATRSGAVVTLSLNLNGAVSVSGAGLTNYDVSTDDFVTLLPKTSVTVSGNSVVINLVSDPGVPVKVRSFYGMSYGATTFALGTYSDGTNIPVEPLYTAITSN